MRNNHQLGLGAKPPYPRDKSIPQIFEEVVNKYGNNEALSDAYGSMSYKELNQKANRVAHHLQKLGVKQGDPVGISMDRSKNLIVGLLAILKAGGVYVPIDQNYPLDRKTMMIEDSQIKILLTQEDLYDRFPFKHLRLFCLDAEDVTKEKSSNLNLPIQALDLAYICYTSGSTGRPKGVEIYHRGVIRQSINTDWMIVKPSDRVLNISNISFDATTSEIWGALLNGACLCIYSSFDFSPELIGHFLKSQNITHAIFTARLFNILVDYQLESLKGLKLLISAGEAMSVYHAKKAFLTLPSCRVTNGYGPTENTVCTTLYTISNVEDIEKGVPIGKAVANTDVYILSPERKPVEVGETGELYAGGDGVARGYLNREDLTKEKFIPNPFGEGTLYRTGDLAAFLPDGNILFQGRIDTQVKIRGYRIELEEIEEVFRKHPDISDCVVIAKEFGAGEKRLIAYAQPEKGKVLSAEFLREYAREHLPTFMIPSFFVSLDHIPVTATGKVDQKALPSPTIGVDEKITYNTDTERTLAHIWREVLHLDHLTPHDHFLKIGGDSISAMQIISRINKELQIAGSIHMLFDYPIFRDFASHIESQKEMCTGSIPKRKEHSPIPLSLNQESLWILEQLHPMSPLYIISLGLCWEKKLDLKRLQKSLNKMVKRHEILRTRFEDGKQWIEEKGVDAWSEIDLSHEDNAEKKALALLEERARLGMDLSKLPLLEMLVIKIHSERYLGLLRIHHIIFDGWSTKPFFEELMETHPVTELPIQYGDFALWQKEYLETDEARRHLDYWKNQLRGCPDLLELPWDKPRPTAFSGKGDLVTLNLPRELSSSLNRLVKEQQSTLFSILLTTYIILLHRYSRSDDILVGTPFANRNQKELYDQIGFFVQMLVIRSSIEKNLSFSELLKKTSQTISDALKNAGIPFEKIVEEINPQRNASYNPLFQVGFTLENIVNLPAKPIYLNTTTSKFDLYMTVREDKNGISCTFEYATDLFEKSTIKRMLQNYQTLLQSAVSKPHEKIEKLDILTQQEIHQIAVEWNDTTTPYPADRSIVSLFEEIAKEHANRTALEFENEKLTYLQLNQKANQFARELLKMGIKKQDPVGISLERSSNSIIAILAILKAGAIYVPIDANYPQERKQFMIEDTNISVLITDKSLFEKFSAENLQLLDMNRSALSSHSGDNLNIEISSLNIAYINYTSGSTGKPKGVKVPHRGVVRLVRNIDWTEIKPEHRFLHIANIAFDATTLEVWGALLNGSCLCIYPFKKVSPELVSKYILEQRVSHTILTARLFNVLVEHYICSLKNLRFMYSCGEAMSVPHAKKAFSSLPSCQVLNVYGPTENSAQTTSYIISDLDSIKYVVPIGTPINNTTTYVLDKQDNLVPIGVPGELCTGGAGVAKGYLNREDLTKEKFFPNPFGEGKLYRTGDLVKLLPDGNIVYLGRIDTQVKIRGFRIEIGEIEETLRHHDKVSDSITIAREDTPGDKYLVSYLVPKEGQKLTSEEISDYAREKLPEYMLPSFFLILDDLPVTPTGKIDQRALPSPAELLESRQLDENLSTTEQLIAEIWSNLLKIKVIGKKDNFFKIGGHSITATQASSIVNKSLSCSAPVNLLFEEPVLERYAKRIDQLIGESSTTASISNKELFWIWRSREAVLDGSISPEGPAPSESQYKNPKNVLITGGTGFIGAFFIRELLENTKAKIHCLVRAENDQQAMDRLKTVMEKYLIWNRKYQNRIVAIAGDLGKPEFGTECFDSLASEIDSIFHIGAYVNHALPYQKLKAENTFGTQEIIRLACKTRTKPLHFFSTVATLEAKDNTPIDEDTDLSQCKNLINGYAQSKWVGEKLILLARSRGLPANIYRLSRASGDDKIGSGPTGDFLWRIVQASLHLKMIPQVQYFEEVTPVNFICQTVHAISSDPKRIDRQYHVLNPKSFSYMEIFKLLIDLGYPLEIVDFPTWKKTLTDRAITTGEEELKALTAVFSEIKKLESGEDCRFSTKNTAAAIKDLKLSFPKVDKKLFKAYINYYVQIGFIPTNRKLAA